MARVREPRERRVVSSRTIALLSPFFRRSEGRQAWVLRLIGGRVGPVLVSEHGGRAASYREEDGQAVMKAPEILVRIELGRGAASTSVCPGKLGPSTSAKK